MSLVLFCYIIAIGLFLLATFNVTFRNINLVAAGLGFFALAHIVGGFS